MSCQICYEKYTTKIRKKHSCHNCNQHICSKCVVKNTINNIKSKSIFGPHGLTKITCLFCNSAIPLYELRDLLSKKKYKKLIKDEFEELFNEECNLLEATEKTIKEQLAIYEMNAIRKWMIMDGFNDDEIDKTLREMGYLSKDTKDKISQTARVCCPECNNFVHNYECTNCHLVLCSKCLTIKNANHVCDDKTMETIKKVNETCRNCPNCKLLIEKEEGGCDQMFCIECHTTFSWTTGKIATINDVKHNPHFFEWRRQNNKNERQPNDDPCEGRFLIKCDELEEHGEFLKTIQTILQKSIEKIDEIYERDDFIREQFRIKFLTKKLTLSQWKNKFKQHINTQRLNKETKTIITLCLTSLYHIIVFEKANDKMIQLLFNFVSEHIQQIRNHYGQTIHYVMLPIDD